MIKNPFYNRQRITDPASFFGRKREIDILYSAIVTHQCRSLVGERKIGKSSLLTYIGNPQVMRMYGLDPERNLVLYFDLEGMASGSPSEFWCEILDRICERISNPELITAMQRVIDEGEVRFMQVRRLLRKARDAGYEIALCLDEFEALARSQRFETDFYGELRSLAGELGLVYLTASKRSLYEVTFEHSDTLSSPFFNIFTELPLTVMEDEDANDLLRSLSIVNGTGFCEKEIAFARELAGNHPFFLQLAGFHLYEAERRGNPPTLESAQLIRKRFLAEAEDHYRYLWSQLSISQQMALVNLSQASEPEIRALRAKNLVLEKNNKPVPFSETFAEFLQRQHTEQGTLTGTASPVTSSGTDLTGKTLGSYRVVSPIGRGGMAEVYKGYQPSLDRYVAIKILAPHLATDPSFIERFQREATTVARLRHPGIVQVYDFGNLDDLTYMVMEYIPGPTLKERIRTLTENQQLLPCHETLAISRSVAAALDYAHEHGLVHRDVKPANIILRETAYILDSGSRDPYAVLTDFGVVKMLEGIQLTETGTTLGTPDYMSPEQGRGTDISHLSDIYSLAVVAFEMLVGKLPFTADTPVGVLLKHMTDQPPLPCALKPGLPPAVDPVMDRALAKDPKDRYPSATAFVDALELALETVL